MVEQDSSSRKEIPRFKGVDGPTDPTRDPQAEAEAQAINSGDYTQYVRQREYERGEKFRDVASWIAMVTAVLLSGALLAAAMVWFWHLLAPAYLRFLEEEQLSEIQTVLFSGLLAGIAQSYIRNRLNPDV